MVTYVMITAVAELLEDRASGLGPGRLSGAGV